MIFRKDSSRKKSPRLSEDVRQRVANHLRNLDRFIREGNFEMAKKELEKVREIEPGNVYALALEERMAALEKEKLKGKEKEKYPGADELTESTVGTRKDAGSGIGQENT
ncbi:MAG: hypothetical protein ACP5US_05645, partial [Candidatus Kryptoniota bacterium]